MEKAQNREKIELYYSDIIRMIVNKGEDINQGIADGKTLLHLAVKYYLPHITALVLELGGDPDVVDADGYTPLHYAAREKLISLESILKPDINDLLGVGFHSYQRSLATGEPLVRSSVISDIGTVKLLVENGANVNAKSSFNTTPLDCAKFSSNLDIVHYLIEHGAVEGKSEDEDAEIESTIFDEE